MSRGERELIPQKHVDRQPRQSAVAMLSAGQLSQFVSTL